MPVSKEAMHQCTKNHWHTACIVLNRRTHVKIKRTMNNKKKITMLLLTATAIGAYAQGNGMAGINEATKMVTSYFDPGTKLIYAIGVVVGLIGGIKVYNKFSSGDPDTSKTAAS